MCYCIMLPTLETKVITSYSYHSGFIEIIIASYNYRSGLIGIVIAYHSYHSKVLYHRLLWLCFLQETRGEHDWPHMLGYVGKGMGILE